MPHMLLKMRKGKPITLKKEVSFADSLEDLFNDTSFIESIPEEERYNWFYTLNSIDDSKSLKSRTLEQATHIAFDIDAKDKKKEGINKDTYKDFIPVIAKAIGFEPQDFTIIMSGNGLHFLAKQSFSINNANFYKANRKAYKAICTRINAALDALDMNGKTDTAVFDSARILRLPGTRNIKKGRATTSCFLVNYTNKITDIKFEIPEQIEEASPTELKCDRNPDAKWVFDSCAFMRWLLQNQGEVSEPQWFAGLAVASRLGKDEMESRQWAHTMSCRYPGYSPEETDEKFDKVLGQEVAPSKEYIESLWDGCGTCPKFEKCISPALLRGPSYIPTRKTGFRIPKVKEGVIVGYGPVVHEDLIKFFKLKKDSEKLFSDGETLYYKDGPKYKNINKKSLMRFSERWVRTCRETDRNEFAKKICIAHFEEELNINPPGLVNLKNGVFDLSEMILRERKKSDYFTYCAEYEYDKEADCPEFRRYIGEIMLNREDLIKVLMQVIAYCVSGCEAKAEKAFVFKGVGANGKSVLLKLLEYLVTPEAVSHIPLEDFSDKTELKHLRNSLVNLSPEFPKKRVLEDATFKKVVSGETIQVRSRYADSVSFTPNTKLVISTNNQIKTDDLSEGVKRRMMIIPFDYYVEEKDRDVDLFDKLKQEAPGILNMVIPIIADLREGGYKFAQSEHLDRELETFMDANDDIRQWLSDRCAVVMREKTPASELMDSYEEWCTRNKRKFSEYEFKRDFSAKIKHGDVPTRYRVVSRIRGKAGVTYVNIKLVSELDLETRDGGDY